MDLSVTRKPIVYTWPRYCPACNTPLAKEQMRLELQARLTNQKITTITQAHFPRPCCRRLVMCPIQHNIHNMNSNIFRSSRCREVPVKSSIIVYSRDFDTYTDYNGRLRETDDFFTECANNDSYNNMTYMFDNS